MAQTAIRKTEVGHRDDPGSSTPRVGGLLASMSRTDRPNRTSVRTVGVLPVGTRTEEKLMARYAAGDDAAFGQLFASLAPQLRAFFLRSFVDQSVADDLTQATFLRLHRGRASYSPDRPLTPWVFTMAACERRDELRRRYRLPPLAGEAELEQAEPASLGWPSHEGAEGRDQSEAVGEAVKHLPESQRVVLHLHLHDELTYEEIGEILGTTPGAVRVRASRAYDRLRTELASYIRSHDHKAL
jgi:RNA polymerase sigma-70 factor, ECF subfamily